MAWMRALSFCARKRKRYPRLCDERGSAAFESPGTRRAAARADRRRPRSRSAPRAALLAGAALRRETPQVEFLQQALGDPVASAPLTRKPDANTVVRLHQNGYSVDRGAVSVGLRSTDSGAGGLERRANGVSRRTAFGWEAVTVTPAKTEQFLTVVERQGPKTWRWHLKSLNLTPRVGDDGAVGFIRNGRLMSDVAYIEPVRIPTSSARTSRPTGPAGRSPEAAAAGLRRARRRHAPHPLRDRPGDRQPQRGRLEHRAPRQRR